ncbi:MAG: hypothetical protein LBI78_01125, partial [Campylobacteraceae bacterium]|nr:hypothetical protein [Campylobacteraceae bacterium]
MKKLLFVLLIPFYLIAFTSSDVYYKTETEAIAALEGMGYKFSHWEGVTAWILYNPPYSGQARIWFLNKSDNRIWSANFKGCGSGRCIYHTDLISIACEKGKTYNKSTGKCEPLRCNYNQYINDGVCVDIPNCSLQIQDSLWDSQTKSCVCKDGALNVNGTCKQELEDGDEGDCRAHVGSYVVPKTRELHEDINIAGTDITLHYASSKVLGYKGVYARHPNDIANGWSLSNVHHYEGTDLYLSDGTKIDNRDNIITTDYSEPSSRPIPSLNIIPPNQQLYDESHIGHEFNRINNIVRSFDPKSGINLYTFSYLNTVLLASITDKFGRTIKLNRDKDYKVTSITAPFGQMTYLGYDSRNNLISVSYEDGSSYRFTYNSENLLTLKIDSKNNIYRYNYNNNGRIYSTVNPLNGEYRFDSYIQNNVAYSSFTTPSGDTYSYENQKTNSKGAQISLSRNPSWFETKITKSNNGRDIQKEYCGIKEKISYDIDPLSLQNTLSSVETIMPSGFTNKQTFYTNYEKLDSKTYKDTSTITSNGKTTTVETNYLSGTQEIISPENRKITIKFDTNTYLPKTVKKTGEFSTHYTYNSNNQLTKVYKGLRDIKYTYDSRNNVASITDSLENTYYYDYDLKDRVISVKNPNNQFIYFHYDQNGNMIKLTNPNSNINLFDYNSIDLKTIWNTPLGLKTYYEYDKEKRVTKVTKASGKTIQNSYLNGKISQVETDETIYDYDYDCSGYPLRIESNIKLPSSDRETIHGPMYNIIAPLPELTSYMYDGELLTNINYQGTLNQQISFTYNPDFLPSSITYADEKENLIYDKDGLLIQINDTKLSRDTCIGVSNKITDGNFERTISYSLYNEKDKTQDKINKKKIYKEDATSVSSNGQILKMTESLYDRDIKYIYSYDKQGRVVKSTQQHKNIKNQKPNSYDYVEEFAYDNQGNILKHTITDKNQKKE